MVWFEEKKNLGKEITKSLYRNRMILTWYRDRPEGWKLQSGKWSLYYVNQRPLPSFPLLLKTVGSTMGKMIDEESPEVDRIVGIASTGIPIASAIATETGIPACYTRKLEDVNSIEEFNKLIKGHGQHEQVEGIMNNGDNIALVDDLVTSFQSKLIAYEQVKHAAKEKNIVVNCKHVDVLLDREQGAEKTAKELGFELHSVIKFKTEGIPWLKDSLSQTEYDYIRDYMENDAKYQDKKLQEELMRMAIKT